MRAHCPVAIMLFISAGLFLTACQKKPAAQTLHAATMNHPSTATNGPLNRKDLGVLPLSNHISTTVTLGKNRQCTITPTLMKSGNLEIILAMETTRSDGTPGGMNVARISAKPGEPFDVSIGDMDLAFTPQLAVQ